MQYRTSIAESTGNDFSVLSGGVARKRAHMEAVCSALIGPTSQSRPRRLQRAIKGPIGSSSLNHNRCVLHVYKLCALSLRSHGMAIGGVDTWLTPRHVGREIQFSSQGQSNPSCESAHSLHKFAFG